MKTITLTALLLVSMFHSPLFAQSDSTNAEPPNKPTGGMTKFLLAGKATASWTNTLTTNADGSVTHTNTFSPEGLMLMPLVKLNKKLFLDAQVELDPNASGGATFNLNELIIYYRLATDLSLFAGNFSPKYGLYTGVLDDFTNRYATDPIGMNRGPQTQTGIGVQGGLQAGYSKFNYQLYLSNGPQHLVDTTQGTGNVTGQLDYSNYADNNRNKAIGGSIGFLPFSNSSLQVDVSGQYTGKTGDSGTPFESLSSTSWAADLNYYHVFDPVMVRVLAEYNATKTKNYPVDTIDNNASGMVSPVIPAFNNQLSGWFAGVTLRASGAQSKFLSNLELGGRIGAYTPPKYTDATLANASPLVSPWGENPETQTTLCLTYWFTWKTPLNIAYDVLNQTDGPKIKEFYTRFIFFF